ncbi:MAG: cytochrome P460 family protein [Granulosicoccus sp.]
MNPIPLGAGLVFFALFVAGCATVTAPFREVDERWVDYKSWTVVEESTGDPTGRLGTVHKGPEGYRKVYVNATGRDMLLGNGPYDFPEGTVIVKEQYSNEADWQAGSKAAHTIMVKVAHTGEASKDNWRWANSIKAEAKDDAFCWGCHGINKTKDFTFTNGEFLATQ